MIYAGLDVFITSPRDPVIDFHKSPAQNSPLLSGLVEPVEPPEGLLLISAPQRTDQRAVMRNQTMLKSGEFLGGNNRAHGAVGRSRPIFSLRPRP